MKWTHPEYAEKLDEYVLSDDPPGDDTWIKQVFDTLKKGEAAATFLGYPQYAAILGVMEKPVEVVDDLVRWRRAYDDAKNEDLHYTKVQSRC